MPYIALNEHDREVTSFQCLDEFKREGTVYENFRCAFCEVPYIAKAIYNEASVAKAPHFAVARGRGHIADCNGEVLLTAHPSKGDDVGFKVLKREHEVPEVLVEKPATRAVVSGPRGTPQLPPTDEEIQRRRKRAGEKYGFARFTSSLLASFIEAKAFLVKAAFAKAKESKLKGDDEKSFVNAYLATYPLQLFEQKLNYANAFWQANYWRAGQSQRIFQASNGKVTLTPETLTISSTVSATPSPASSSTATAEGNSANMVIKKPSVRATAVVSFDLSAVDLNQLPRAHKSLLNKLKEAEANGLAVRWSVYGVMTALDGMNCIELASLDHLHFES